MRGDSSSRPWVIGCDPTGRTNPTLVAAVARAGGLGILDLHGGAGDPAALREASRRVGSGGFGVRASSRAVLDAVPLPDQVGVVVLPGNTELAGPALGERRLLVEVVSADEAAAAVEAGADGLIAVGAEAGGRVGADEAFVLLQRVVAAYSLPVWVRGGIGLHTAAAAVAAGAAGVVLDGQLGLTPEAELDPPTLRAIRAMDGSETRVVGGVRFFSRPDLPAARVDPDAPTPEVTARVGPDIARDLVPLGQDAAFASTLAAHAPGATAVVAAVERSIGDHLRAARPLAPDGGVAVTHRTALPVVQGPMTRVSDRPELALAVAEAGGLPFLALALLRAPEAAVLLESTAERLGDRPWGVGILGFVPPELREEQMAVLREVRPPVALVAGGRPGQAAQLEELGVPTYLHVPSVGLLERFHNAGARRFVFEGRECGGHVGPRSSFVLWEQAVELLLGVTDPTDLDVLFAGGIHDGRSAAAVAAAAAPLVDRGARIGVLMGTAYVLTAEAVSSGAVSPVFQAEALACRTTALLETAPGHAVRCATTPFVDTFAAERERLTAAGRDRTEVWTELEQLNLGRLRIASKALVRADDADGLRPVAEDDQRREGMFMLGQVATLHDSATTIPELHQAVTEGTKPFLEAAAARLTTIRTAAHRTDTHSQAAPGTTTADPGTGAHRTDTHRGNALPQATPGTTTPDPGTGAHRTDSDSQGAPGTTTAPTGTGRPDTDNRATADAGTGAHRGDTSQTDTHSQGTPGTTTADPGTGAHRTDTDSRAPVGEGADADWGDSHIQGAPGTTTAAIGIGQTDTDSRATAGVGAAAHWGDSRTDIESRATAGMGAGAHRGDGESRATVGVGGGAGRGAGERGVEVAIVGMAAMFPGARDVEEFWAEVVSGRVALSEVPASRWDAGVYYGEGAGRTPSKWGGFLLPTGIDALAHGIPPRSLASIDPAQLLSLEVAARALADAGYGERPFDRSRASVIFGAEAGTDLSAAYGLRAALPALRANGELDDYLPELTEDSFPGVLTNVIAGRIANRLDLGGVNYTVDAACAASLAAVDLGCKELTSGTSDLVLCGAVDLHNGINDFLLFASVHALSPTGACRTFDAAADGIALGEGVACVVLKRLDDARRDGDRVYAVIEGVGGSSDGRSLGLTAPRAEGQRRAIERAWDQAGCGPGQVGLVEAHGTGTVVGDRTELATLTSLFADGTGGPGGCVLGSVKSQIGHTKCAAGLAGLIKAARALYHRVLPPTANLTRPNPFYDEATSPFRFLDHAAPWMPGDSPRRAAVSAFGFGGTNFHTVLREADSPRHGLVRWPAELVLVRAADRAAAVERMQALSRLVDDVVAADPAGERHALRDLAHTVWAEGSGPVQFAFVARDLPDLAAQLRSAEPVRPDVPAGGDVAFLFPGQGSQRVGMLGDLLVAFPFLAAAGVDPRIFPGRGFSPEARAAQEAALTDTRAAQPALGSVELAVSDLLAACGIEPASVGGHSYGELVALGVAGALDRATLQELSVVRGRAVHDAAEAAGDPGTMAAVAAPAGDLEAVLARHPAVVAANENGPRQTVVSGPTDAVAALVAELDGLGIAAKRLPVACAFHSPLVAAAAGRLADHLADVAVAAPRIPVWSNTTATPYPDDPDALRDLLARQVASPVRFAAQVEAMYAAGARIFVEAGPGRVLTGLVDRIFGDRPHLAVPVDVPGEEGLPRFLSTLADLARHGVPVDPGVLFEGRATRVDLAEWPLAAPGWTVDGHLVRDAGGEPVPGGLRPATEMPALEAAPTPAAGGRDATVVAYIDSLREIVAAERDVMLRFLGEAPTAAAPDAPARTEPAPAEPASPPAQPPAEDLLGILLAIVEARTGYPADMLGPDLDLEAELSIDSIKRVEIVAELAERLHLPNADDEIVEELVAIKTLRGIVDWLEARDGSGKAYGAAAPDGAGAPAGTAHTDGPTAPPGTTHAEREGPPAGTAAAGRSAGAEGDVVVYSALDPGDDHAVDAFGVFREGLQRGARELVAVVPEPDVTGVTGLMRTLAVEFPDCSVRLVTAAPGTARDDLDALVTARLTAAPGTAAGDLDALVTAARAGAGPELAAVPEVRGVPAAPDAELFGGEAVVLVTGGARGITGAVAAGLAATGVGHLCLVGRTELADDDADPHPDCADLPALRQAILAHNGRHTPGEVEAMCRQIMAVREVRATLAAVTAHGASAEYVALDVRDGAGLRRLVGEIHHRHGRLDGVIHGAGVIEDAPVAQKTVDSFRRVFDTKVVAARALLDAVPDEVGFVVFFGSVSGVYGNRGQADYAAANQALDALAVASTDTRLAGRVLSVDWGPWRAGMVSPERARVYERRGVGLLDPADGVAALLAELAAWRDNGRRFPAAQVLVAAEAGVLA